MATIIQASIMLLILTSVIIFLMAKLVNITKFNIAIYLVLIGFWVSSSFLKISIIGSQNNWEWPLVMATYQFTQMFFRLPLGKLSQKLRSRKIPLLLTVGIMILFSLPLIFIINLWSLFLAMFGLGFFATSFGMQNQYWSENWNIKNVFISVGLVGLIPYLGRFIVSIAGETTTINKGSIQYVLIAFLVIAIVTSLFYLTNKENKNSVMFDNMDEYVSEIKSYNLKHVIFMTVMISFISISINLVKSPILVYSENKLLMAVTSNSVSILSALLVAFILIRILKVRTINIISHLLMFFGLTIMLISNFTISSHMLSLIGFLVVMIGASMYTISMTGVMLHFDHKNTLLVLGIWLSVKSGSLATGTILAGEVAIFYPSYMNYLIIISLLLVLLSSLTSLFVYKKYSKPVFKIVEQIEYGDTHKRYYKEWK